MSDETAFVEISDRAMIAVEHVEDLFACKKSMNPLKVKR